MSDFPLSFLLQVRNEMSAGIQKATSDLRSAGTEAEKTGQKVKSSGVGIAAGISLITTQFVNTINSIISLKRQYEDLTRKQNDVVQSGNTLQSLQNRLKNAEDKLAAARAGPGKASADELRLAEMRLHDARNPGKGKKGDPTSILAAEIALKKERNKGKPDLDKIVRQERNVENMRRRVINSTISYKEKQVDLQRAIEDFYLQTIPTAVGVIGSFASVLQLAKGSTISLGGALSKFILPIAAISAGFFALKTNFLGITDFFQNLGRDVGNAIPELKPFLSLIESIFATIGIGDTSKAKGLNNIAKQFMDSFRPITEGFKTLIDNIMKGNWSGAFNKIKEAAMGFYKWLRGRIPFLADVEALIQDIRNGNWSQVFEKIKTAAVNFWIWLKTNVPLLADVEKIITLIKNGDWEGAFKAIVDAVRKQLQNGILPLIFGENWESGVQAKFAVLSGDISNFKRAIEQGNWKSAFSVITQGAKDSGFQELMDKIIKPDVSMVVGWGTDLLNSMATAINNTATSLDSTNLPKSMEDVWAGLNDFINWVTIAGNMMKTFFMAIGAYLIDQFQGPIAKILEAQLNLTFAGARMLAVITNMGIGIANALIRGLVQANPFLTAFAKIASLFDKDLESKLNDAVGKVEIIKPIPVPPPPSKAEIDKMVQNAMSDVDRAIGKTKVKPIDVKGNTTNLTTAVNSALKNIPKTVAITIKPRLGGSIPIPGSRFRMAEGFHGTVSKPTMIEVGEKGTERVDVTPIHGVAKSSRGNGGAMSGGGGPTVVNFIVDSTLVAQKIIRNIGGLK